MKKNQSNRIIYQQGKNTTLTKSGNTLAQSKVQSQEQLPKYWGENNQQNVRHSCK